MLSTRVKQNMSPLLSQQKMQREVLKVCKPSAKLLGALKRGLAPS